MKVLPDGSAPCLLLLGANSLFVSSFFFFWGGGIFSSGEKRKQPMGYNSSLESFGSVKWCRPSVDN